MCSDDGKRHRPSLTVPVVDLHHQEAREAVAKEHRFALLHRYSEREMAGYVGWSYSTAKRKRRSGKLPYVDMGGGSVVYLGFMIADIILVGVRAKELCQNTDDASFKSRVVDRIKNRKGRLFSMLR